jgi:hypothetical protein
MSLSRQIVLAIAALLSSSTALAGARVDCPSTQLVDGKARELERISVFDGPPEKLADLMPDPSISQWDISLEQRDAKARGESLFLVCRYARTNRVVTLPIPGDADLCKLEGTKKGLAGWCTRRQIVATRPRG